MLPLNMDRGRGLLPGPNVCMTRISLTTTGSASWSEPEPLSNESSKLSSDIMYTGKYSQVILPAAFSPSSSIDVMFQKQVVPFL